LFSCKIKTVNEQKGIEIPLRELEKNEAVFEVTGYPLPTSFYITSLLQEAEAPYLASISNSVENINHYFSQRKKALNLGVYGADLCYAVTFMKTQQVLLYLNASKRLLNEINAYTSYYKSCCERVEENLDDEDSLITIISDSFFETYNYLYSNQKDKMAVMVIAGSWIESLYIATQIGLIASNNSKIMDIIAEEETSLDKLLEVMKPVKEDKDVIDIYQDLAGIKKIYSNSEGNISQEQFEKLTKTIDSLRNKII
jgi:hypothetical protein